MIQLPNEFGAALAWRRYKVSSADKAPLLDFVCRGLTESGCTIVYASDPGFAPFYIVFESPAGDRQGLLVYAFFANSRVTKNRPNDEHRFQIKYGGDLKSVLHLTVDPHELVTTLLLGIDPERGFFVAADPLMNTPAPMSRSVEFKAHDAALVAERGWHTWERDRRPGRTKDREKTDLADVRTEVLIGGTPDRLIDLIALERVARGLDPGERHLLADKFAPGRNPTDAERHPLLNEFQLSSDELLDLIGSAGRLKMAVRGWVAEAHLADQLKRVRGVTDCERLEGEGQPDIRLRWKDSSPFFIECKNTLRTTYADGRPKVDFQKTRASKGDPCSRYYAPEDFPILAACLHAVTEAWEFQFAMTRELPPHRKCGGKIANMVGVTDPVFTGNPTQLFDRFVETRS